MTTARLLPAAILLLVGFTPGPVLAQTPVASDSTPVVQPPNAFGTGTSIQTIPVVAMTPNAGASYLQNNSQHRYLVAGSGIFYGSVDVPSGSLVAGVELEACDGNASMSVGLQLLRCAAPGGVACTVMADVGTPLIGAPGCGLFAAPSILTPVIDNQNFRYVVVINITGANTTVSAGGVRIAWVRQVSPAPATASFADVPVGNPLHPFVEALVAAGITGGCGGGNYCPNSPLTRGQMAVFLAAALGLHWPN
jgi:hypothetical protein